MMTPPPVLRMAGQTALAHIQGALKLRVVVVSHDSSGVFTRKLTLCSWSPPALLTQISNAAKVVHHRLNETLDFRPLANVGRERKRAAAAVLNLLADILEQLLAASSHGDIGACFGEAEGDATANAAAATRHHRDFPIELEEIEDAHAHALPLRGCGKSTRGDATRADAGSPPGFFHNHCLLKTLSSASAWAGW